MKETPRVARRVVVHGHVQGVFYRHTCKRHAESRGVSGWVRNLPDGTVEAWFEGAPDAVERLVDWARVGPEHAVVERADVAEVDPTGLTHFEVRY